MRFFSALPVLVFNQEIRDFQQRQREIEGQNSAQNVISFKKSFITEIFETSTTSPEAGVLTSSSQLLTAKKRPRILCQVK